MTSYGNNADKPSWLSDDDNGAAASSSSAGGGGEAGPSWASVDVSTEAPSTVKMSNRGADHHNGVSTTTTPTTATTSPTNPNNPMNLTQEEMDELLRQTWCEFIMSSLGRDGRLILFTLLVILLNNVLPFGRYVVYPFTIFSTWIHETCHGMAALLVGYDVTKLEIFNDGSGLAYSSISPSDNANRRGFVASAGYQGTAIIGFLLLLFRRTKRGPRVGLLFLTVCILLTILCWIRNPFGVVFMSVFCAFLGTSAWFLPRFWMVNLYTLLAVTTALNAIFGIRVLFGFQKTEINGKEHESDADTMADLKFGTSGMWAFIWLSLAIVMALLGVFCAIPGPDEKAELSGCLACQQAGCFACCNAPGMRFCGRHFGPNERPSTTTPTTTNGTGSDPVV